MKGTEDTADSYAEEERQDVAAAEHDEAGRLTGNIIYILSNPVVCYRFYFVTPAFGRLEALVNLCI